MALEISNQYLYTGRGPFDAKSLVKTYADLLLEETWKSTSDKITAYNGMVVAVWLNKEDTSKNGVYYLHDSTITSTFKAPDVTKGENWHKLASFEDIAGLTELIQANANKLAGIETTVVDLINEKLAGISNVDLSEYAKITDVDNRINTLIGAADPEGGKTIENIQNLVKYVDENADAVASLISDVNANTSAIEENAADISALNDKVAVMLQPKESAEISVAADGTLGIKELNVNKLVQTPGDMLVLSGGTASILV
jgi:hypothetical protein